MNIILYDVSGFNAKLLEYLTKVEDISLYLAVSVQDTFRIINEVKPEAIIFGKHYMHLTKYIQMTEEMYPAISIYLHSDDESEEDGFCLTDYRNQQVLSIESVIRLSLSSAAIEQSKLILNKKNKDKECESYVH